jgi:hypothetical protein
MTTTNGKKALKKKIEKMVLMTFGRILDPRIDFEDDAWDLLDDKLDFTIGKKMDKRLEKAELKLSDWWTKPYNGMTGKQYTEKAVKKLADKVNEYDYRYKITVMQLNEAYEAARKEALEFLKRAARRHKREPIAPILCDSLAEGLETKTRGQKRATRSKE